MIIDNDFTDFTILVNKADFDYNFKVLGKDMLSLGVSPNVVRKKVLAFKTINFNKSSIKPFYIQERIDQKRMNEIKKDLDFKFDFSVQYYDTFAFWSLTDDIIEPAIFTKKIWMGLKPYWDKGDCTRNQKLGYKTYDEEYKNKFWNKDHLNKVYNNKPAANNNLSKITNLDYTLKQQDNYWTTIKKNEFRKTNTWKNFVRNLLLKNNYKCEHCKQIFNHYKLHVHHIIEDYDYDNLDEKRFKVLCNDCHNQEHKYWELDRNKIII